MGAVIALVRRASDKLRRGRFRNEYQVSAALRRFFALESVHAEIKEERPYPGKRAAVDSDPHR
jgi:hypothetical protein